MSGVEEWYKQWSNDSNKVIDDIKEETKQKLEKLRLEIIKKQESYFNPIYKKYAKNETKSIVDISYIYNKIIDGISEIHLMNKQPVIHNKDLVYEYGFNENNKCLYRKVTGIGIDKLDRLYVYLENTIYELEVSHANTKNMNKMTMRILGEYIYDEHNYPLKIERSYGILNHEEYDWINEKIAIINCGINKYILIKDDIGVYAIFQKVQVDKLERLFSYKTQNYVVLNNNEILLEERLSLNGINMKCYYIKDLKGKYSEYRMLNLYGENYLVSMEYTRPQKDFSYKKAKEIYQTEILEFIREQMQIIEMKIKFINIQYFNCGYSIMDILIGFDEIYCEDVESMKIIKDVYFSDKNIQLITYLNHYINDKMYFRSFKKVMESLKKSIEQEFNAKVLLIEISD